jgi:UDP-N-acetylmuramyl pentapeptide phosphotransferase/UDP-N-acetylglucosamine-1-phosphate transferase
MSSGLAAWLLLLAGGAVAAAALERAAAPILGVPALRRENYRGHELATAGGIVILLAVLVAEAVRTALAEFGVGEELSDSLLRAIVLFTCFAFAMLGMIDDLLGVGEDRGFGGHLRALGHGRLTTGSLKLFGGGVVAIVLAAAPGEVSGRRLLADAALIALAANLGNLFDRAPGRTIKVALIAYVPVAVAAGTSPVGLALAPVIGAAAGLLHADLGERLMLGDTGANLLGAVLGVAVVLETSRAVRTGVLVALVVLNLASERLSFSRVIAATPGLRELDRLGQLRLRGQPGGEHSGST